MVLSALLGSKPDITPGLTSRKISKFPERFNQLGRINVARKFLKQMFLHVLREDELASAFPFPQNDTGLIKN